MVSRGLSGGDVALGQVDLGRQPQRGDLFLEGLAPTLGDLLQGIDLCEQGEEVVALAPDLVIGSSFVTFDTFRFTFLAAVFLSNLPEAIGSAVGMQQAGFSTKRIFTL